MIRRLRLVVIIARPAVMMLLALFAATGLAQAGRAEDPVLLGRALVVVLGFLMFSVACNDLADEAIDRVNLPGDPRRPLVTGAARRPEMVAIAATAAVAALAAGLTLRWPAAVVTAAGLVLSAGYSLRPVRLADRGAVASLVLPACYVAVPFLVGVLAGRAAVRPGDLALLAGLYAGFVGRILLKDFRDVRGDALFGKRTFLVRHGRRWTCVFSAACWTAGAVMLLWAVRAPTPGLVAAYAVHLAIALALLRALAAAPGARREEALVSALAIVGRGMVLALLAHLSMTGAQVSVVPHDGVLGALTLVIAGQSWLMARRGPVTRLTVPRAWAAVSRRPSTTRRPSPAAAPRR